MKICSNYPFVDTHIAFVGCKWFSGPLGEVSFILPKGLHKTQIYLMTYPHCTHAASFRANKKIGVLAITHVLLLSRLSAQCNREIERAS